MNQEEVETSPFLLPYLAFLLKKSLVPDTILPIEEIPQSDLGALLVFPKEKIVRLIDLLGLTDLAIELRSIVDKKRLEKITSLFSKDEKNLLEYFSKQGVKWIPPSLGIAEWDGEKETLFRLLHHRGLIRLGKAVAAEEESFLWHLIHKLDIGRGEVIQKWAKSEADKEKLPYFKGQVIDLLKRFSE